MLEFRLSGFLIYGVEGNRAFDVGTAELSFFATSSDADFTYSQYRFNNGRDFTSEFRFGADIKPNYVFGDGMILDNENYEDMNVWRSADGSRTQTYSMSFPKDYDAIFDLAGDDIVLPESYSDLTAWSREPIGNYLSGFAPGERIEFRTIKDIKIYGDEDDNFIEGGETGNRLVGRDGDDIINGHGGQDTIAGNRGDDVIKGNEGRDIIYAGSGDDKSFGGRGDDKVYASTGNDFVYGNHGHDNLFGGDGKDRLFGGVGDDVIYGGIGEDRVFGGSGNGRDVLYGGDHSDHLFGGDGADVVGGGAHMDFLSGGRGNDRLFGGTGSDRLRGQHGDDRIFGGAGRDFLEGGIGDDTMTGGDGSDTFFFAVDTKNSGNVDIIRDYDISQDIVEIKGVNQSDITISRGSTGISVSLGDDKILVESVFNTQSFEDTLIFS